MTSSGYSAASDGGDEEATWDSLLSLRQCAPGTLRRDGIDLADYCPAASTVADPPVLTPPLLDLYLPLLDIGPTAAIAHLGQSLDGRIATASGASHYVTGQQDILHNHRMRALCDAVLVGAGTVRYDDPQLTVRLCTGPDPVRVVVDTDRRLDIGYHVFQDRSVETLVLTAHDMVGRTRHGNAEVIGAPRLGRGLCPHSIRDCLAARGLNRLFIEGGGITVSRFLQAKALDLLQVTVAPLIIGSGRMGISLPEVQSLSEGLRPPVRYFRFGDDIMVECDLRDGAE